MHFFKELKARKAVQNGGRKVLFLFNVILFSMLFQLDYIGFCFLVQCISKHGVMFLSPFWRLQMFIEVG